MLQSLPLPSSDLMQNNRRNTPFSAKTIIDECGASERSKDININSSSSSSSSSSSRTISIATTIAEHEHEHKHRWCALELTKIRARMLISLLFAVLPGGTVLVAIPPPAAHGLLVPIATSASPSVPSIAAAAAAPSSTTISNAINDALSPSSLGLSSDQLTTSDQRRSADVGRLLLEDFNGRKRPKLPASVKRQMDLQDNRLANCQESSEAGNWEQCFFYGTDNALGSNSDTSDGDSNSSNGKGNQYFGSGTTSPTPSSSMAKGNGNGKPKIPTW